MQDALGVLGWSPETFWRASLVEYFAAIRGWNDHQHGKSGKPKPMTRDEFDDLVAWDQKRIEKLRQKQAHG